MLMNTSSSSISKRRHEICFVNRTQSDLERLQDKTEKWIRESLSSSKHHDDIDLRLPTLPRDLSSNLAPHALSRRLRNANIRDNKKNPDESLRSTFTRYFRGKRKGDTGSSNMTTTQILATRGQEVEQHIKLLIKSIHRACVDKKISASFPPSFLREFLGLTSTSSRKK
ncbi:hypothetical protein OAV88_00015 [bacterium]|nr:hypothetical protein [bacterium]